MIIWKPQSNFTFCSCWLCLCRSKYASSQWEWLCRCSCKSLSSSSFYQIEQEEWEKMCKNDCDEKYLSLIKSSNKTIWKDFIDFWCIKTGEKQHWWRAISWSHHYSMYCTHLCIDLLHCGDTSPWSLKLTLIALAEC